MRWVGKSSHKIQYCTSQNSLLRTFLLLNLSIPEVSELFSLSKIDQNRPKIRAY